MILQQFPDLQWLKTQAENAFSDRKGAQGRTLAHKGWPTVILNVNTTSTFRDNIRGPLSIFTNLSGESSVSTNNKRLKVPEGCFIVTNHNQYYTLEVDQRKTETFNIHFGEHFAERVFQSLSKPELLLESDDATSPGNRIEFYNHLRPRNHSFNILLSAIRGSVGDTLLMEEKLVDLMMLLIQEYRDQRLKVESLPAIKNSTRDEIMKRLLVATDYIHAYYQEDVSLETLAMACCLSKFHFLRLFKIAFNRTPHQYLNEVRMIRAKELLKNKQIGLSRISPLVGLKDSSSFSRMFYKHTGVYPSQYRNSL
jgi:AraC family transcriptional regulator